MGHLQEVNESYTQHLMVTIKVATRLVCAAGSQIIHGLLPDVKPPFNNDLDSLIDFLTVRLPCRREQDVSDDELYTNYGGD